MAMTVPVIVPRRFRPINAGTKIKGTPFSSHLFTIADSANPDLSPAVDSKPSWSKPFLGSMAAVQFNDADVAVGAQRLDQTLIGRLCGPLPALSVLRSIAGRVWKCDFSVAVVEWDLLQFVFPNAATAQRIRAGSPWRVFEKFLVHTRKWESPTAELAAEMTRVPLMVQMWGVPYYCCTERLGSMLGAALGASEPATIHRSVSSGGLFIRAKVTLDLHLPLPDEVTASHEDPEKGQFKAKVKYESLPQFCFLCGVVGHVNRLCPRKEELAGQAPRYGKELLSREFGPRVHEGTLARRRKRYVWTLGGSRPGAEASAMFRAGEKPLAVVHGGNDQVHPAQMGMTSQLGQLCLAAGQASRPNHQLHSALVQDVPMIEANEPQAKKPRLGIQKQASEFSISEVEATGPNRSQPAS